MIIITIEIADMPDMVEVQLAIDDIVEAAIVAGNANGYAPELLTVKDGNNCDIYDADKEEWNWDRK